MTDKELLDEIVRSTPIENIPFDFIMMARLKQPDGINLVLKGEELYDFFADPGSYYSEETVLVVNAKRMHAAILEKVAEVYEEVGRRQQNRLQ